MNAPLLAPPQGIKRNPTAADVVVGLTGKVDAATIAAGLALLPAAGGTVFVKAGTYAQTVTNTVPAKPVKIVGAGKEAVTIDIGANVIAAFTVPGDEPFLLENITVHGNGSAGQIGVTDTGAGGRVPRSAITIKDCEFGRGATPIRTVFDSSGAGTYAFLERLGHVAGVTLDDSISGNQAGEIFITDCDLEGSLNAVTAGDVPATYHIEGLKLNDPVGVFAEIGPDSFISDSEFAGDLRSRDRVKIDNIRISGQIILEGDDIQISNSRFLDQGAGVGAIETDGTTRTRIAVSNCVLSGTTGRGCEWAVTESSVVGCVNWQVVEIGAVTDKNEYWGIREGTSVIAGRHSKINGAYRRTTAPGVGDDINDGVVIGDRWVDTTADRTYTNLDNAAGAAVWQLLAGGPAAFCTTITPATLAANVNNYDPGDGECYRLSASGARRDITGLAPTGGNDDGAGNGRKVTFINVGAEDIRFINQSGSSTAANRFLNESGTDFTISTNESGDAVYDPVTLRWRMFDV